MALKFYNTLSRQKEEFKPAKPPAVGLYTCGPTVYNYPHIGNYRAYIFGDILKRYLNYLGFDVRHVMNLTDVDDKTIRDSQKSNTTLKEFTEFYARGFFQDLDRLNIAPAHVYPKATEHITEMVTLINHLLEKGVAYKTEDGSIYFNIKKFKDYGKLAHLEKTEQKAGASGRVRADEYSKENIEDFALWKSWTEDDGDVFWLTPWGKGRPGWHIECSAMSMKHLGESFDIHTGGIDLVFPHHENEIAQAEGSTGKPFVKYWLHNEWLLVDGKKMSKSLGNFYTLRDLINKGYPPLAYRYLLTGTHYRTVVNFTWESLTAAENALRHLYESFYDLGERIGEVDPDYQARFAHIMDDDLDTPGALALVWDLIKDPHLKPEDKKDSLLSFDQMLGLGLAKIKWQPLPEKIQKLVSEREAAREKKDFTASDKLRDEIKKLGFEIDDTKEGAKVRPKLV
ncbi:MAG TPA: cysteine--tRNA ligase [Candidatus Paceibacterota bacterium]|nr:cysteine--tRNA ligase [Candidatus Paceibacterota bacterium]